MNRSLLPLPAFFLALSSTGFADLPATLHTQGRIVVNNVNFTGTGQFKFLLFTDPDANHANGNETALWKNDSTTPANLTQPASDVSVPVTNGLYSALLGDPPQAALPPSLVPPAGQTLYLRTWFDDGTNGSQQLAPDQQFSSVPFAKHADISGQNISALVNDANYVVAEDFDFSVESDSASYTEAQLGGPSGSFATSFTFTETFPDVPSVTLSQTTGITNPVVSNVTTTGFDLDFDYTIVPGATPLPATEPWPHFDLINLGGDVGILYAEGPLVVSPQTVLGNPVNAIDSYPDLKFVRTGDTLGSTWSPPVTFGPAYVRSLAFFSGTTFGSIESFDGDFIAGAPSAAYVEADPMVFNPSTGALPASARILYRRASDALGTAWASPVEVALLTDNNDGGPQYLNAIIGTAVSIAEIGALPAVLYNSPESPSGGFPPTPGVPAKVNFARASDLAGSTWQITDTGADPSLSRSNLAEVDGKPAFVTAALNQTLTDPILTLQLHRASDATGTTWTAPVTIWAATLAEVGTLVPPLTLVAPEIELFDVAGRPAVAASWAIFPDLDLRYLRANDAAGASWPAPVTAATNAPGADITSLAAIDDGGVPVITYRSANDLLRIAATDAAGTSWNAPESLGSNVKGAVAMLPDPGGPISAASSYDTAPPDLPLDPANPGSSAVVPVLPTMGSISIYGDTPPSLTWTADDPADVALQQQTLAFDGTNLSILAGNSVDLSPLTASDHGALTGLLDDDHPQYFLGNGSEPFGGNLNLDGNNLLNAGGILTTNLTVTGNLFLPNASISNLALNSSVMIQNENVSLLSNDAGYLDSIAGLNVSELTNDAGYLDSLTGLPVSDLLNDAGYIPDLGDATLTGNLTVTGNLNAGLNTTASGTRSSAFGHDSESTGPNSMTWGFSGLASGTSSTAWGSGTTATSARATAFGIGTSATNLNATSWGDNTTAGGANATAFGNGSTASGNTSTAFGRGTTAESFAETTLGRFDTNYSPASTVAWNNADRLLVIGKGSGDLSRADALVMLKNGDTTLNGDLTLNGAANLDDDVEIDGNVGIVAAPRSDAQLTLQATPAAPHNLVLMNSGENSALAYWSLFTQDKDTTSSSNSNNLFLQFSSNGSTFTTKGMFDKVSGAYTALSDRMHKKNVAPLEETLPKISELSLHRFHFHGQQDEAPKEVGVIAQELREIYPSLVKEASDTLTVNYSSLSVIALKAIQEQQALIEKQQATIDALAGRLERLENVK